MNRISIQAVDELDENLTSAWLPTEGISNKNPQELKSKLPATPRYVSSTDPPNSPFIETLVAGLPTPRNLLQELDEVSITYKVSRKITPL